MADPARRQHQRFPCDLAVEVLAGNGAKIADGRLKDLGMGGGMLDCPKPLQRGVSYEVAVPRGKILKQRFPARVAWEGKPDLKTKRYLYGLAFVLTVKQEGQLKLLVDEIRQGLWSGDAPTRDYWAP